MNGKGLSMMTMEMFSVRAPNGGKTLFKVRCFGYAGCLKLMVLGQEAALQSVPVRWSTGYDISALIQKPI